MAVMLMEVLNFKQDHLRFRCRLYESNVVVYQFNPSPRRVGVAIFSAIIRLRRREMEEEISALINNYERGAIAEKERKKYSTD